MGKYESVLEASPVQRAQRLLVSSILRVTVCMVVRVMPKKGTQLYTKGRKKEKGREGERELVKRDALL